MTRRLRLAIPNKGRLVEPTLRLLHDAGLVFEEHDRSLVALKLLHAGRPDDPSSVRRFRREACAAVIGSTNICTLRDMGTLEDGTMYLVMERLYGVTLADVLAREIALSMVDAIVMSGSTA